MLNYGIIEWEDCVMNTLITSTVVILTAIWSTLQQENLSNILVNILTTILDPYANT